MMYKDMTTEQQQLVDENIHAFERLHLQLNSAAVLVEQVEDITIEDVPARASVQAFADTNGLAPGGSYD